MGETFFEVRNPVEYGKIEVTFELDLNGILKMTAKQQESGDTIEAIFKSSRGVKIKQSQIIEQIISHDDSIKNFIERAENLLLSDKINNNDKTELSRLIKLYKEEKIKDDANITQTESQLFDLMNYLEEDDNY
jgi:molecular chaperone DnaK (HSP70)